MKKSRLRYITRPLVGLLVFALCILMFLHSSWGLNIVAQSVLARLSIFDHADLTVAKVEGWPFSRLILNDVRLITSSDSTSSNSTSNNLTLAQIERAEVGYNIWPMLRGEYHLKDIVISKPSVSMQQWTDQSWDLFQIQDPSTDTSASTLILSINHLNLQGGNIDARAYSATGDSTYTIENLSIDLSDVSIDDGFAAKLNVLRGTIWIPDENNAPVDVTLAAEYDGNAIRIDTLGLKSDRSFVDGSGRLLLAGTDSLLLENELKLKATPLHFDDIRLIAPYLAPRQQANLDIDISTTEGLTAAKLDVRVSDGSTLNFEGTWDQRSPAGHVVKGKGITQNFNPQLLAYESPIDGQINADLTIDVSGEKRTELSGIANLSVLDSQIAGMALDSTVIQAIFNRGRAALTLLTGHGGAMLKATGSAEPFADVISYDLAGELSAFDLQAFTDSSMISDLNADIKLAGSGITLEDADASIEVTLTPSRINNLDISSSTLSVAIAEQRTAHDLRLTSRSGSISSVGQIGLFNTTQIETLQVAVDQFDLMALLGDTLETSITGNLGLAGEVSSGTIEDAKMSAIINRVKVAQYSLYNGSLAATLNNSEGTVQSNGTIESARYNVAGTFHFSADSLAYEITRGRFTNLNIGDFMKEDAGQYSDLNGSLFLVGSGIDSTSLALSGRVELDSSLVNDQQISAATTWFALKADTLTLDLDVLMPEGQVALSGRASGLNDELAYSVPKGSFEGIDIGKIIGNDALSSDLNGLFSMRGRGFTPASMTTDVEMSLTPSHFNEVPILDGAVSLQAARNAGAARSNLTFDRGAFSFDLEANSLDKNAAYDFEGQLTHVDLARFLRADSTGSDVNFSITGTGTGFDLRNAQIQAQLLGSPSSFRNIALDTTAIDFHLEDGMLHVDTLLATSNIAHFTGSGPIALFDDAGNRSSSFSLRTKILDLTPLESVSPAHALRIEKGGIESRLFGRPGTLRLDTRVRATGFVYNAFHIGDLDARITGEFNPDRTINNANLTGEVIAVSVPGFIFEEINLEALYADDKVRFATNSRLDQDRSAQISGNLFLYPDSQEVGIDLFNLKLDEDQWQLKQPTSVHLSDRYRVDQFELVSNNQRIALDGGIDLAGEQDLQLALENFRVGTVADLLGFAGLDGPLTTAIELSGPADAPTLSGDLNMQLITYDKEIGDLSIIVDYDSLALNLDAALTQAQGRGASMKGALPINLALTTPDSSTTGTGLSQNVAMDGGIDFVIDADSMAIDWVLPFIDPTLIDYLEGTLTAQAKIEGTAQDPTLQGAGRLVDGKIRSPLVGVMYEEFNSDLTLEGNLIELTNAQLRSGEGFVAGNGTIELSDITNAVLDLKVTASEFLAISTREYRATASGDMDLTGSIKAPVLNGDVTVLSADMFLNQTTTSDVADLNVQLTQEDLLMLEREFGIRATAADTTTFDFLEALQLNVDILLGRDVWIRSKKNPEMNIQFSGSLDVSKQPFDEYIAFGSIDLIPDRSYINQLGKRFDITLGNLTFNGPATDPRLDFEARYEVPARRSNENAVTIFLDAEGQLDDLDLTLRGDPAMELTDILSYIATGQPASEALQLGGASGIASSGAGFAVNQGVGLLTGAIETLIQDTGLELDVIQIEPLDNGKGATITAGKYVTPRVFTAVSQPIGASDSDGTTTREESTIVTLELELIDSILLRLLGGESVLQINLLWHHSY